MTALLKDPTSGLMLPRQFVDEKQALKKVIDEVVENAVRDNQHIDRTYYLTIHAKFDKLLNNQFSINRPIVTFNLPPFVSNQFVFWVNNSKSIIELLWMTSKKNGKIAIEFNKSGVAYLQAKGAMPS